MADETTTTATVNGQPATIVINQAPATSQIGKGIHSTEFWLTAIATIGGLVMASGLLVESTGWGKIVGLILSTLAAMGYTAQRTALKKENIG